MLISLAKRMEIKHNLFSLASEDKLKFIKYNFVDIYNTYIVPKKALHGNDLIMQLASQNEEVTLDLTKRFRTIISEFDNYSVEKFYDRANSILELLHEMHTSSEMRKHFFDVFTEAFPFYRQSDKNTRDRVFAQFNKKLSSIHYTLKDRVVKELQKLLPKEVKENKEELTENLGKQRERLSRDKLKFFADSIGLDYGLGDIDVLEKVLSYDDLREKLTTVINAISRGKVSKFDSELREDIEDIMIQFKEKEKLNNKKYFDEEEYEEVNDEDLEKTSSEIPYSSFLRKLEAKYNLLVEEPKRK